MASLDWFSIDGIRCVANRSEFLVATFPTGLAPIREHLVCGAQSNVSECTIGHADCFLTVMPRTFGGDLVAKRL